MPPPAYSTTFASATLTPGSPALEYIVPPGVTWVVKSIVGAIARASIAPIGGAAGIVSSSFDLTAAYLVGQAYGDVAYQEVFGATQLHLVMSASLPWASQFTVALISADPGDSLTYSIGGFLLQGEAPLP